MFTTDQVALQLYTIREAMAADFLGTLGTVAEAGYKAVEFAGLGDHTAAEVRARLDELGLRTMGAHTMFDRVTGDLDGAIDDLRTLGAQYLIVPWLPADQFFRTPDQVRALAETLNEAGPKVRAAGLELLYHNHDFEFRPFAEGDEATLPYELLLGATDAATVGFELDVFWAEAAGQTAHRLIRSHPDRFPSLHVKDMGDDGRDRPFGEGKLSWNPVLEAGEQFGGSRWLVVEQDTPQDPLRDVATSFTNLAAVLGGN